MGQYNINTPKFRASFVHLFDGKENDKGEARYGCTMLFPPGEDLKDIKALATQIMTEKFGSDKSKWPKKFHKPWKDSAYNDPANEQREGKPYEGYVSGSLHMNCMGSDQPVEVVDAAVKPILVKRDVYSGCYADANIDLFWFEARNNNNVITNQGISCSMNCFRKLGDGEPLGGGARPQAASVFKPMAVNTTKGASAVFADDEEDPMA